MAYQSNESKVSSRKTSFGYGKRLNFILENKFTPGPDTYSLPTEQFKKSCFLADSRDKVVSSSYISRERLKVILGLIRFQVRANTDIASLKTINLRVTQ